MIRLLRLLTSTLTVYPYRWWVLRRAWRASPLVRAARAAQPVVRVGAYW